MEYLKEDCQAFGVLISETTSLQDAFSYPLTTYPLSISNPDGTLRQG